MFTFVSRPSATGTGAFPLERPRRGEVDELVYHSLAYRTIEGFRTLFCDVHVPRRPTAAGPAPVIVWVHGGAWVNGSRRRFAIGIDRHWMLHRLLLAGFAVARVDYRMAAEADFPAAVDDLQAAVVWLREHAEELGLDRDRVALWGESAGAHLCLLAAARPAVCRSLAAVIDWYAPTDLPVLFGTQAWTAPPAGDGPGASGDAPGALLTRRGWLVADGSPVHAVTAQMPPTLIVHGRDDALVPPSQSVALLRRMRQLGADVEFLETDGGHVFEGAPVAPRMIAVGLQFLARRMGVALGPWPVARDAHAMRPTPPRFDVAATAQVYLPDRTLTLRVRRSPRPTDIVALQVIADHADPGEEAQAARLAAALPSHVVQVEPGVNRSGWDGQQPPMAALTHDDVMAAIGWCRDNLEEFGARRVVLTGDGAQAALVLAAAAACRDAGIDVAAVVVNHPVANERAEAGPAGLAALTAGAAGAVEVVEPSLSLPVADPTGLPPIVVGVGGLDPALEAVLADTYRWREAGVDARLRIFPGLSAGYAASDSTAGDRACVSVCREASELLDAPPARGLAGPVMSG